MTDFDEKLDESLERLAGLIDKIADSENPDDVRKAITAASQLCRLRERIAEARRESEPRPEPEPTEPDQDAMLESIRCLVDRYAPGMGYVRE